MAEWSSEALSVDQMLAAFSLLPRVPLVKAYAHSATLGMVANSIKPLVGIARVSAVPVFTDETIPIGIIAIDTDGDRRFYSLITGAEVKDN